MNWKLFRRIAAIALMVGVLGGCIAETEPNDSATQAQANNKYPILATTTNDFIGGFSGTDGVDTWKFNVGNPGEYVTRTMTVAVSVDPGKYVLAQLQHCITFHISDDYPICTFWSTVEMKVVGDINATDRVNFAFANVSVQPDAVVVGCFVFHYDGCGSSYLGHEFGWWQVVMTTSMAPNNYGLRVVLS